MTSVEILACEDKQWFVDNAILLMFGALFLCIALFVMLQPLAGGSDDEREK